MSGKFKKPRSEQPPEESYETPPWVTHALLDRVRFHGRVLEPAAGSGMMARAMRGRGMRVSTADLREDASGAPAQGRGRGFLQRKRPCDNVITNPPFTLGEAFARHAISLARYDVALLLRVNFLCSKGRYAFFRDHPPALVLVFSERIHDFYVDGEPIGKQMHEHAWFVWRATTPNTAATEVAWIPPRN